MGELIVLDAYRRTCHNCMWHDDAHGACKRPDGWEWDKHYTRCITFAWRYGRPGVQKEADYVDESRCDFAVSIYRIFACA